MGRIERTNNLLPKCTTGIKGLDEITGGGIPKGRPTLICGNAGCGKTLIAMEFIANGAAYYNEPGLFIAFEETIEELKQNFFSLGFNLSELIKKKKIILDHIHIERSEIEETGEYDLEGLFIGIQNEIEEIGVKRIVLDTIEVLFAGLSNEAIIRAELRRLFKWLKDKGMTTIVTGERGEGKLTRFGIEEYVADCVITLENRVNERQAIRNLRVIKYRGSSHGTNEYPFLINNNGISVLPITSVGLGHEAASQCISSGIPRLDTLLNGKGYFRGSSILVAGTAGSGKTTIAAHFAEAACRRGERCIYFAFEESSSQIIRNMKSVGINFDPMIKKDVFKFQNNRPQLLGLEAHLLNMHSLVDEYQPSVIVVDPITAIAEVGDKKEVRSMLMRLIDYFKYKKITAIYTSLAHAGDTLEKSEVDISSLMDTWIQLRELESGAERNRVMYILKSRGMAHSNQLREFQITSSGVNLIDVYLGTDGKLITGSSRIVQDEIDTAEKIKRGQEIDKKKRQLTVLKKEMESQNEMMRTKLEAEESELNKIIEEAELRESVFLNNRNKMAKKRRADNR